MMGFVPFLAFLLIACAPVLAASLAIRAGIRWRDSPLRARAGIARLARDTAFPAEDDPVHLYPLADLLLKYGAILDPSVTDARAAGSLAVLRLSSVWDGNPASLLRALRALLEAGVAPANPLTAARLQRELRAAIEPHAGTDDPLLLTLRFEEAVRALRKHVGAPWLPEEAGARLAGALRATHGVFPLLDDALACLSLMQGEGLRLEEAADALAAVGPGRFEDALDRVPSRMPARRPSAETTAPRTPPPLPWRPDPPVADDLDDWVGQPSAAKRLHEALPVPDGIADEPLSRAIRIVLVRGFIRPSSAGAFDGKRRISMASLWRQTRSEIMSHDGNRKTFDRAVAWLKAQRLIAHDRGWHAQPASAATPAGAKLLRAAQSLKRPSPESRVNVPDRHARA